MVVQFTEHFSLDGVVKLKGMLFTYSVHAVELQVRPNLCFTRNGRLQLVQLAFTRKSKGGKVPVPSPQAAVPLDLQEGERDAP